MKQHKNDFNPGPLTELVCSGRSCYQANMPDNDRAQIQQPVEGQLRLITLPRRGSPGIERVKADGSSHVGLKHKTKAQTGNSGIIHLYLQVKSPGFLHCLEVTEFRRRTISLESDPAKTEMVVLYQISGNEIPQGRNADILPSKALKQTVRNLFSFGSKVSPKIQKVKPRLKTCFRWRKTMSSPELVFSPKKLEFLWRESKSLPHWVNSLIELAFTCEANTGIFEAYKFGLCQS